MTSDLGTAASGQEWEDSGNWAIEDTDTPYAIFGNAVVLPFYNAEDGVVYGPGSNGGGHILLPTVGATPRRMGRGGQDTDPLTIMLDRPTSLFGWASANITNDTTGAGESFNVRFFLGFTVDGVPNWGHQSNIFSNANDSDLGAQRLAFTMHQMFVWATVDTPVTVLCWWAYLCDANTSSFVTIRNQKMEVMTNYAPDYTPDPDPTHQKQPVYSTKRRSLWTPFGVNRRNYRGFTNNVGG